MFQIPDRCWLEINLDQLCTNYRLINNILHPNCQLMGVVKGNAYGAGMLPVARALSEIGCHAFGVATYREAHELRNNGISGTVLVLGPVTETEALMAAEEDVSVTVNSLETARQYEGLVKQKRLKIHIKVDTGMSRLGIRAVENPETAIKEILQMRDLSNLEIEGIFTHLCDAYNPDSRSYTTKQLEIFREVVAKSENAGMRYRFRHCASSSAAIEYPDSQMDMVRIGASLYGMFGGYDGRIPSKPLVSFRTKVLQINDLPAGCFVGYNCSYQTQKAIKTAVVAVGNADGYYRYHSGNGFMLYKGIRVPVIGIVCMDMVTLDISKVENPQCGDVVTIFGEDCGANLPVMEAAGDIDNTLPHEIYNGVPVRVPRYYFQNGELQYTLTYRPTIDKLV